MSSETPRSGIYDGMVVHQRFLPKRHRLSYRMFQILLDLDRIDAEITPLRLLSHNRFNLFSFNDQDHGPDQADRVLPLKDRVRALLRTHGLEADRLFLLAMPRVLGFVFNPISVYFAYGRTHRMQAIIYEVNNTCGDRHSYVMPVTTKQGHIRQVTDKRLHVSPFMETGNMRYEFDLIPPAAAFALNIRLQRKQGEDAENMLFASFTAHRKDLTDTQLWRLFWMMPLMNLKVVAGLHWEAVKLLCKGIWLKPKPPTPRSGVSLG